MEPIDLPDLEQVQFEERTVPKMRPSMSDESDVIGNLTPVKVTSHLVVSKERMTIVWLLFSITLLYAVSFLVEAFLPGKTTHFVTVMNDFSRTFRGLAPIFMLVIGFYFGGRSHKQS